MLQNVVLIVNCDMLCDSENEDNARNVFEVPVRTKMKKIQRETQADWYNSIKRFA